MKALANDLIRFSVVFKSDDQALQFIDNIGQYLLLNKGDLKLFEYKYSGEGTLPSELERPTEQQQRFRLISNLCEQKITQLDYKPQRGEPEPGSPIIDVVMETLLTTSLLLLLYLPLITTLPMIGPELPSTFTWIYPISLWRIPGRRRTPLPCGKEHRILPDCRRRLLSPRTTRGSRRMDTRRERVERKKVNGNDCCSTMIVLVLQPAVNHKRRLCPARTWDS